MALEQPNPSESLATPPQKVRKSSGLAGLLVVLRLITASLPGSPKHACLTASLILISQAPEISHSRISGITRRNRRGLLLNMLFINSAA